MSLNNWSNRKIITENTSSYMDHEDLDIVEEARGKKIVDPIRAKLMGMEDIRDLKGTMTPRYFATKVIRFLQKENPELDLENLSNDDIQNAINVVSQVSKPLAGRSDVKITTRERGAAKEGLKKGDTGFETLQLNLGDDTTLKSEGGVGDNDLYTVVSDGLKYRVTLNSFKGTKINLDDISQNDVVSVVIVKPSETEKVDKFGGEIEMGDREKLVADFPEGEEDGMSNAINAVMHMSRGDQFGVAPEDEIDYKKADLDKDGKVSEYELARAKAVFGDEEDAENQKEVHPLDKDLDDDGEIKEYEKAREEAIANAMKKEQERAGQSHARAVADHYEDEDEPAEDNILPVLGIGLAGGAAGAVGSHLMKKALPKDEDAEHTSENDNQKEIEDERKAKDKERQQEIEAETRASRGEEDAERCPVTGKLRKKSESEEEEQVAMSQQEINNYLLNQYRQRMQNAHTHERNYRHGY